MDGKSKKPRPTTLAERVAKISESTSALVAARVEAIAEEDRASTRRTKARVVARAVAKGAPPTTATSNALPSSDEANTIFSSMGAIFPPYEPESLVMLFEHSNALRSNVDSYVTNIESFGYRFEPTLDLDGADADAKIADAMFLEALHKAGDSELAQAADPGPEQVENKKTEIRHAMRLEKARLEQFVEGSVPESSLVDLREKSRVDYEVTGNAYWEVLRNVKGDVSQFAYLPAHSIRLLPIQPVTIEVRARQRVSALSTEFTTKKRRFRSFVQMVCNRIVFFKEFGDPRSLNALTGRYYDSDEAMKADDAEATVATEIVHFRIHSPRTPYGVPRWMGNLLAVLGSRAAEEVNYLYFDNKAIPPIAVLVSGGKLAQGSKDKLESYIKDHIKGKENFHRILILEAVGSNASQTPGMPDTGRTRIEIEKLTDQQQSDGLFQDYDERNIDKLGSSFRLPRLVRGDVRDFNRATAEASLEFAEMQVFQPERNRFDDFVNRQILPQMGVRFWKFVSNTPVSKDPATLTEMICKLLVAGSITPEESRELARDVFNRELKKIDEEWTKQPIALTLAGYIPTPTEDAVAATEPTATAPAPATPKDRNLAAVAANLAALRDKLRGAAKVADDRAVKERKREYDAGQVIKIELSKEELAELIEPAAE